ncbi:MAG: DEAD/DEAH box helicase [Streptococcaceae bacterium]|nr:DEAD/DEAH box helicase [Streptococcaceae bacterium]MCL2680872.1 DEAD/DEAH box helicase [Streptococcaceae bacterium]MCL2858069.1 DEAD/DEAH box helicase [Streptococcaceae bacterium]
MVELYEFQKQALANAEPSWAYGMDTGTGKTLVSLHHYKLYGKGKPLLVVCPPAVIKGGGWQREIERLDPEITYTLLSYGKLAKSWKEFVDYFVIFDEAHYIKNPTSQRGKAGFQLSKTSTETVLISATLLSNGWIDAINYFKIFGLTKNKTQFLARYAIYENLHFGSRVIKKVVDFRRKSELNQMFTSFSTSISKHDALDLPEITFQKINFKKSKEYKIIEKDQVLDDVAFDTSPKLAAGFRYYANIKDKAEYIKELAEGTTDNIIVFYQFTKELEYLKSKIKDKTIFEVHGKAVKLPSYDERDRLKNSVTFVQYQAGGAGIELQYATIVIYHTPTYSYQDYAQSLGRAYRNGQTQKVTVYQFETKATIELAVWQALEHKKDFNEKIYLETRLHALGRHK